MDNNEMSRVCAVINTDNLILNLEIMHDCLSDDCRGMIGVIKTDAYGHGAVELGKILEEIPYVKGYATATAEEAILLRRANLKKPILILGYVFPYAYEELIREDVRIAVFKEDMLIKIDEAAQNAGKSAHVHVKVDTGMGRIGVNCDEDGFKFIKSIENYEHIKIEGIFSHFARADEVDKSKAKDQLERFKSLIDKCEKAGIYFPVKHIANSAAILEFSEAHLDLVRAGITLYGLSPSDEVSAPLHGLKPLMELKSHIVYIKEVKKGSAISYGGTYVADSDRRIATIPVGYGDGYPRSLSNKGYVLIHGYRAPICGRVCMDQMMVDVTDIPDVKEYDEVTLMGKDGDEFISAEFLGDMSGRFNYELVCDIGRRVPRKYVKT